jgi:hypothetical protein
MGICGDKCIHCPRYIATQNGGTRELEKVKELWVRLGLRDPGFPSQDMACDGCKAENKCAYKELRACVCAKGIENCGSCDSYPCELINRAFQKSDALKSYASEVCTQEEMDMLEKAFFSKKEYFDRLHQEHQGKA